MSNEVETELFAEKPGPHQALEQELNDYAQFLKIQKNKFKQYKIILESVKECLEDEILDSAIKTKVKRIILSEQVRQIVLNENCSDDGVENVLGVPLTTPDLTYPESNVLKNQLKTKIEIKCCNLKQACLFSKQHDADHSPLLDLAPEDAQLIEQRKKLTDEQLQYNKNKNDRLQVLEDLTNLRLDTISQIVDLKCNESEAKSKVNHLKSVMVNGKCHIDILSEYSNTTKAYTELLKDMKQQKKYLMAEIQQLNDLKKKYAEVSCKEFDDIWKSYLQYFAKYEKRKLMYQLCE